MDNNGEIVRFYDTTYTMPNGKTPEFDQEDVEYFSQMSVQEYQDFLTAKGSDVKAGFTAQSLAPGMGEFEDHAEVAETGEYDQTIDTMVEEYAGRTNQANAPPVATYANYGTFELTEGVTIDMTSVTGFKGLSELDETAISPYEEA